MSGFARSACRQLSLRAWLIRSLATLSALALALCVLSLVELPLAATPNAEAVAQPPPSELVQLRTQSSRTFDNHDGTFTSSLYSGPIHYRDGHGEWRPISSALVATDAQGYAYQNEANRFRALFKQQLGPDFLGLETGGGRFKLTVEGASAANAQARARGIWYPGAFSGVDLRYELLPDGVKETLLLANGQAPTSYHFTLSPPAGARIHAVAQDDGSWAFFMRPHARPVFVLDAPWAVDDDSLRPATHHATLDVTRSGADFLLDLSLDSAWLRDPQRQFPVTVDPTITIQPAFQDASFDFNCMSCAGVGGNRLSIGTTRAGVINQTWRSALQFSLADIPVGATVSSAKVKLYFDGTCLSSPTNPCGGTSHEIRAYRMTNSWSVNSKASTLTWDPNSLASFTLPASAAAQWMNWDITPTVQSWVTGSPSNFGLLLKRFTEPVTISGPTPPSHNYAAEPTLGPKLEVTFNGDGGQLLDPETVHANGAELRWIPYSGPGSPPFDRYEVHRSASASFTPSHETRLTTIMDSGITSYRDTTAKPGATYTYKVVVNGNETNSRTVTMPADGQATKLLRPDPSAGNDTYFTYRSDLVECTNRGVSDRFKVGTDVNSIFRSLLRFDLADIPIDATVTNATLSLWHPDVTASALTVNLHRATSPWQEGTSKDTCSGDGATWYESDGGVRWTQDGGDFDSSVAASLSVPTGQAAGWHAYNLTTLAQAWAHGDYPNDGLLLKAADETISAGKFIDYYTSDFAVAPTLRPKLAITYSDGSHASPPIVSITKPAANEQVSGSAVTLSASAIDDRRVDSVQFLVDGTSVGTDTSEPFSVSWNSTTLANGSHNVTARATDDAGNQTTSPAVSFTVGNSAPPLTSITSPSGGATVSGTVTVAASASDDLSVTKVTLFADGLPVADDASAPYSFSWNTLDQAQPAYDGQHTLTTRAYDAQGQFTTSAAVSVTVGNATGTKFIADLSATAFPTTVRYDPSAPSQEQYGIDVTVTNRSALTWAAGDVVLRYRWLSPEGTTTDSGNLSLGGALLPNGSTVVHAFVVPPDPGAVRVLDRLRFDLYDVPSSSWFAAKGNKPLEHFVENQQPPEANKLGLEPYYQYETLDLGAGMQQSTNVANGNSVIRWVPFQATGRGLDTTVELTYNNRERCNGHQAEHDPCLAGNGWSFAISSVLRFGSQIVEHPTNSDLLAGRTQHWVELIDADGTSHVYTSADNGTHWDHPDGFHYYLHKVSGNWLLTAPDRTTYAYNADGFPLYTEDKNQNRITFVPDDPLNPKQVVAVQDAGNRNFWITYYDSRAGAHVDGRVHTITDHMNHVLDFVYYKDGNLLRLTQHGGADGDRSFVFNYTHEGSGTDPAITSRASRYDPDPGTANQSDRVFSVQDPRTIAAHTGNESAFGYSNPPGAGQDWEVITGCDRANATTASFPCLAANATTKFTYADHASPCSSGTCTVVAEPLNRTTTYWYGTDGLITKIIDPLNRETDQTWTARHLHEVIDQPTGRKVEHLYNANGLITDEFDQLGNHIHYEYTNLSADQFDNANSISLLQYRTDAGNPNPGPNHWTNTYDANNINLLKVTDPTGAWTEYSYYADGTLHTVEGPNHHTDHLQTVYEDYDANGLSRRVTDEKGQVTKSFYDADGLQLWSQDANHAVTTFSNERWYRTLFQYNNFHELVRQSEPKSTHLRAGTLIWNETQYDPNGNVASERQPAYQPGIGVLTTTTYDGMDRQTCVVGPKQNQITTYQYDAAGRLWRTTLPNGVATPAPPLSTCPTLDRGLDYVTENAYDALDRVITETQYDETGAPTRKTHYCYDGVGDLRWVVSPMAHLAQAPTSCDPGSPPTYTTRYTYDAAHRRLTETEPLNTTGGLTRTRTTAYDANGNVKDEYDENNTNTHYTYTTRGELETTTQTFTTSPLRTLVSKTVYDAAGNVACEASPRATDVGSTCAPSNEGDYTTHYTYDAVNQLEKLSLPTDSQQTSRSFSYRRYDGNGNLALTTLPDYAASLDGVPLNKQTNVDYYDPGWIAASNDNVNPKITYDYEAQGWQNLRTAGHRWGNTMRWQYSPAGEMTQSVDRQTVASKFSYDLDGNEASATRQSAEQPGTPQRFDIESTYNGFDELTKARQLIASDTWRSTKYAYWDDDSIKSRADDGTEHANGNPITLGRLHDFTYDEAGQVKTERDLGTDQVPSLGDDQIDLTYEQPGWEATRIVSRLDANGTPQAKIWTGQTYFASGDLASLTTRKTNGSGPLLEQHTLGYLQTNVYLNGNRVSDTFQLVGPTSQPSCRTQMCTTTYEYGPRENLTWERRTRDGATHTTQYWHDSTMNVSDEFGDGVKIRHYAYDGNHLTDLEDGAGNVLRRYFYEDGNLRCVTTASSSGCPPAPLNQTAPASLLEDYRWNGRDRLSSYRSFGQSATSATYHYDPLDRPVSQTDSRGRTDYSYIGLSGNVSSETLNPQGLQATSKFYSYGPSDERVGMTTAQSGDYYYERNVHSDVSLLLNVANGDAAASYAYKPYGGRDSISSGDPEDSSVLNPYRFNDKRFDPGSSTLDMGARRYNSDTGRFMSMDSLTPSRADLSLAADYSEQNRYGFAAGNPIMLLELDGHSFAPVSAQRVPGDGGGSRLNRYRIRAYVLRYAYGGNPKYRRFPGTDCTNFASQALHAGGWTETNTWNYTPLKCNRIHFFHWGCHGGGTAAWNRVQDLVDFALGSGRAVSAPMTSAAAGDIITADWDGGPTYKPTHMMVVDLVLGNTTGGRNVCVSQHTSDRREIPLRRGELNRCPQQGPQKSSEELAQDQGHEHPIYRLLHLKR